MASDPPQTWEILFRHALELIEDARRRQIPVDRWSFGGGTVLMRRHRHRLSKDVDIFIDDPQFLGYLTPRLSPVAEALTSDYAEDANYVKLRFPEGEVDFVVAAPLTSIPTCEEDVLGTPFLVEYSGEIIAKKNLASRSRVHGARYLRFCGGGRAGAGRTYRTGADP